MTTLAPVLMVQGTASSAGKSTLVAGLCRLLARQGLRVAPFKAQNMSNNAAVCAGGGEIGRAQFAQAIAAGVEPTCDMNPILLKPQPGGSQVIVRGQVAGRRSAAEYFGPARRDLWPVVAESLDHLRAEYDLVVAEGAGSPAEINLRSSDLVNMQVALHAQADVLIVADIDRGGAFAALLGTWEWLTPAERDLVRGFVLNKFRGDATLLAPAPALLEQRTGIPVIGVVPYVDNLLLPEEDAASLSERTPTHAWIEIAIVRLPHLANFDEFAALSAEPGVHVRWVSESHELRAPDLVILPGSKATIADLVWLHECGLGARIRWLVEQRTPVLGICGGYQMLGLTVSDVERVESDQEHAHGLGLLPISTEMGGTKRVTHVSGRGHAPVPGIWAALSGIAVDGYEIHIGQTSGNPTASRPLFDLESGMDGCVALDGVVAGTCVHGVLEQAEPRHALLHALSRARGFAWTSPPVAQTNPYDALAAVLAESVRLDTTFVPSLLRTAIASL
ncbi:MAG TPA: cobyric acid synthase [Chloroflexota bacterium]|jgi:adenosylcobyric acid synthase